MNLQRHKSVTREVYIRLSVDAGPTALARVYAVIAIVQALMDAKDRIEDLAFAARFARDAVTFAVLESQLGRRDKEADTMLMMESTHDLAKLWDEATKDTPLRSEPTNTHPTPATAKPEVKHERDGETARNSPKRHRHDTASVRGILVSFFPANKCYFCREKARDNHRGVDCLAHPKFAAKLLSIHGATPFSPHGLRAWKDAGLPLPSGV